MTTASLALPFATLPALLSDESLLALRRRALRLGRGLAFCSSSAAMALFLWLLLAGPGFLTDGASVTASRGGRVVAQR